MGVNYGLKVTKCNVQRPTDPNVNEGFIITSVNGVPIKSIKHFRELLKENDGVMLGGFYSDGIHDHYYLEDVNL